MTLIGLIENDYGSVLELTVEDGGTATDISGYTTRSIKLLSPSGTAKTKTAIFKTDGSDGKIQYTLASGDIDKAGTWWVQVYLANTTQQLSSEPVSFSVGRRLS